MGRLIYVWYCNFEGNRRHCYGAALSQEYLVTTDIVKNAHPVSVRVKINKNKEYACQKDFYGKNIDCVTAVVGENGSGKTTFAQMLMNYEYPGIKKANSFFWIEVSDDGELILYKNQIEVQNVTGAGFEFELRDWNTNLLSMVYLSNMFNFAELCGSNELEDVGRNNYLARQVYTPAALLKTSRENAKKGTYGYKTFDNQYFVPIQKYAEEMERSDIQAYIKKQEELIIEGYMSSSEAIKKELDIFQCCEIKIREFAEDLITDAVRDKSQSSSHMADAKKCYEMLRTTVLKDQKENFWLNIYILCVAEIYLAFCGYDGRQGREILAEIKNRAVNPGCEAICYLRTLISSIKGIEKLGWGIQIKGCLDILNKYFSQMGERLQRDRAQKNYLDLKDWELGVQDFEDIKNLVEWYSKELKKPQSFFKRNLRFDIGPVSTGELALLNLFSYIADAMAKNSLQTRFLIIIDEIDAGLHPRWQQKIMKFLLDWLGSFKEYRFQLIVTSHSPIVLSDILKEHVILLSGDATVRSMESPTFGANIAMQFLDVFYMDEGNIGEFAKEKIGNLISRIDRFQTNDSEERRELLYLAGSVGDPVARRELQNRIMKKNPLHVSFMEEWERSSDEERRKVLEYMRKQHNTEAKGDR